MQKMWTLWRFPGRLLVFWLLFFAVFRLWFVCWFRQEWSVEQPENAWYAFWYALPLDLSFAGYILLVPIVFWHAGMLLGQRYYTSVEKGIFVFNLLIISTLIIIFGANVFIYEEWQTPLNNRAIAYFKTPRALLDSMSFPFKVGVVLLFGAAFWLSQKAYRAWVGRRIFPEKASRWVFLGLPIWLGLIVLAIRGGIGVMPINESAVYFSAHLFDNHAATNPGWSLGHSLVETRSTINHYQVGDSAQAQARVRALRGAESEKSELILPAFYTPKDASKTLNVVFLILESHTAQVVAELGGIPGVCPNLGKLTEQGVLFTQIYGSGYRTDQGIISILAGYPAQPDQSIILLEDKASTLPSVPKILKKAGYSTAFLYGGALTFANLGLWLTNQRFDKIISERDFSADQKKQRWGVDDQMLLQRTVLEINQLKPPFFVTAMTLSLHPPYDVPFESKWNGSSDRDKFLNSAAFVDEAIRTFFEAAQQQDWYDNTLFVLVADHGASQPGGAGMDNPASRQVPLWVVGKPLAPFWRGKRVPTFGNHHDIPATLFRMMEQPNAEFAWSKDLWQNGILDDSIITKNTDYQDFAYYTNENGLGWVTPRGKGFFEFGIQQWRIFEGALDSNDRANAGAYLQVLYDDFLGK